MEIGERRSNKRSKGLNIVETILFVIIMLQITNYVCDNPPIGKARNSYNNKQY